MKSLDLSKQQFTVDELLRSAEGETVLIRSHDGHEFFLEAADQFEQEVAAFAASEKFLSFLAQRSQEEASLSLEDIEQRLSTQEP